MPTPIDITAVLGSVTPPGRRRRAIDEALQRVAARNDVHPVLVDLADTPVYRGSFTGALKNLLDHVPVAALRDVLSFFGAHPLPTAVYLASRDFHDGVPGDRAAGELDELLEALVALTQALQGKPLPGPAPLAARF